MKVQTRNLMRLMLMAGIITLTSMAAMAQSTGTVTVGGTVNRSFALRWWSFTNVNGVSGTNAPNTQNSPLAFTLDLGDVSPNNTNAYAGGKVRMIMRSNAAYTLSAQVTSSTGFGTAASGEITLSDVGFGIHNFANSGTLVSGDPAADASAFPAYKYDPTASTKDTDGVPQFTATLNDFTTVKQLMDGPRISRRGGLTSPNNGLLLDAVYAVGPQFFTPSGAFSATMTFTMATP